MKNRPRLIRGRIILTHSVIRAGDSGEALMGTASDVTAWKNRTLWHAAAVLALMLALALELIIPASRQSMAFDEGCHAFAGYSYWTKGDFGVNPEHPPLVKMLAALPLLNQAVHYPTPTPLPFKPQCFIGAKQFFYSGRNADVLLFRARMAAAMLTVAAALVVFAAGYEMFGAIAALLALLLFVFEPNLAAHGAFITTDMGASLFLFATVYAFYRYVKKPSAWRLALSGMLAGLTLAAKHSGILWIPILCLLALAEILRYEPDAPLCQGGRLKCALRFAGSLLVVGLISFGILWAFYGFRYQARPDGEVMIPSLAEYAGQIQHPWEQKAILFAARRHVLPESYLIGLVDIVVFPTKYMTMYLFGRIYRHAQWFYFPAAFLIKSTLGFLALVLLLPVTLRQKERRREILFLLIPPVLYFVVAARSDFNIGVRHILPVYPFLIVLAAFGACQLARRSRKWAYALALLFLFHVASSVHAFPNYLAYSNELWGGPENTYKYLTDSNVDWAQQLKSTRKYLDEHGIKNCWFDYFGRGIVVDPIYYGIICKPLPDFIDFTPMGNIPTRISGTILISATELSGELWGPGELNPYTQFQRLRPDAIIDDGVLVFHGEFDVPLAAALAHARAVQITLFNPKPTEEQLQQALTEAQAAVSLAPNDAGIQETLAEVLMRLNRKEEALATYRRALTLAQTIYPDFEDLTIETIKQRLQ
jgi:4-amino-4-deoxy-L-arabinose transferase-like glycosyltransferase